jgi:ectoine hydrolase
LRCEDIANAFFKVLEKYGINKDNRASYPIGISYPLIGVKGP